MIPIMIMNNENSFTITLPRERPCWRITCFVRFDIGLHIQATTNVLENYNYVNSSLSYLLQCRKNKLATNHHSHVELIPLTISSHSGSASRYVRFDPLSKYLYPNLQVNLIECLPNRLG